MSEPTHVAVPIKAWAAAISLIAKELTIEKGLDVYTALKACKPILVAEKQAGILATERWTNGEQPR